MESLPPVKLGAIILITFGVALLPRKILERRWVLASPGSQAGRQMALDMLLVLCFGVLAALHARYFMGFPPTGATLLGVGFGLAGFFIAVDMALARERETIVRSLEMECYLPPPKFYSFTRKFSLVAISSTLLTTLVIFLVVNKNIAWLSKVGQDPLNIEWARQSVAKDILFIMGVFLVLGINMIWSYSRNMKLLFENETRVLEGVSNGDLSQMVPVVTNDEFGVIAGHTNTMIRGLNHRKELLGELKLAEEVQQNLLPSEPPVIEGLDIAGTSQYCSQTGGDYYDFMDLPGQQVGLLMADASGHGVGAALHMATARSIFRTLAANGKSISETVTTLNQQLTRDTWETGRFMTFSYTVIDMEERKLSWVRAGHDPAFLYIPESDGFEYLDGKGIALGLRQEWNYSEYTREGFEKGMILVVATDGIWEMANPDGDMLGKPAVMDIIRKNAQEDSRTIMQKILDAANAFRGNAKLEDDMTIIVAKAT